MKWKHELEFVIFLRETTALVTIEDALIRFSVKRVALRDC